MCARILLTALGFCRLACAQPWLDAYDPTVVRVFNFSLSGADWTLIKSDPTFEIEVPAMFSEAGEAPILVGLRRKSGTALGPTGQKISLKVDINQFVAGQSWRGMKKLSLENGDDEDVLAEGMGWLLHRLAALQLTGSWIPTSGIYRPGMAAWCAVVVNGEYLGCYVNVEQPDKSFLQNRGMWTPGASWLYKVDDPALVTREEGTGDSPAFQCLCFSPFESPAPCPAPSATTLESLVAGQVDMTAWMHYAAVSAFHGGSDQLFTHGKNCFFCDRLGLPRMYLPWDLDSVFKASRVNSGIYGQITPTGLIQTLYQQVIINHPTFRAEFNSTVDALLAGYLSAATLNAVVTHIQVYTAVPLAIQLDPNGNLSGSSTARFQSLRTWISQRAANIAAQTP